MYHGTLRRDEKYNLEVIKSKTRKTGEVIWHCLNNMTIYKRKVKREVLAILSVKQVEMVSV